MCNDTEAHYHRAAVYSSPLNVSHASYPYCFWRLPLYMYVHVLCCAYSGRCGRTPTGTIIAPLYKPTLEYEAPFPYDHSRVNHCACMLQHVLCELFFLFATRLLLVLFFQLLVFNMNFFIVFVSHITLLFFFPHSDACVSETVPWRALVHTTDIAAL